MFKIETIISSNNDINQAWNLDKTSGGDETKEAPLVYIPHLVDKVAHLLKEKSEIQMPLLLKS